MVDFYKIVVGDVVVALNVKAGASVMKSFAGFAVIEFFEGLQRRDLHDFSDATRNNSHSAPSENIQYLLIVIVHQSDSFMASLKVKYRSISSVAA